MNEIFLTTEAEYLRSPDVQESLHERMDQQSCYLQSSPLQHSSGKLLCWQSGPQEQGRANVPSNGLVLFRCLVWLSSMTHLGPKDKPWSSDRSRRSNLVRDDGWYWIYQSFIQLQDWFPGVSITERQCKAAIFLQIPLMLCGWSACACHLTWLCFQLLLVCILTAAPALLTLGKWDSVASVIFAWAAWPWGLMRV